LKKLTAEEEQDIEERSTAFGMFNMAESYWRGATTLHQAKVKSTHPDSPVSFLYYHAIELYLKSYLRLHGHTVKELSSRKFGHKTCCLTERAAELGLEFMDEDIEIFSLMARTDAIIRSRYLQTGAFTWPTTDGLDRVCKSIREPIGKALKKAGYPVRGIR
jgi:hypothetical protein